ncbi:serine/threonine-protein kinase [Polyangium mundeleinium]|uniref:Protein kinase n=1 Tax=Polyangium mundeleinium TaxID=2995306 RepID=A0ABT5EUJ1_9BACT|nr:protein kinase [Polyangium mundeleinium]MDC0744858.1 protein kinase [Polyangium mundeleinium]
MSEQPLKAPPPPPFFGPYQTTGTTLGKGGMGVVYEATHVHTGEVVAIKTLHGGAASSQDLDAIRHEIRALRRLRHPGIVPVVDHGDQDGVPWMAMQCLRGRTLHDHLRALWTNTGASPVLVHLLTLIRRLCAPLAYLHGEGLVHRDLKPRNVFLQDDDRPVLVDLGIATRFGGAAGREELDIGTWAGTLAYMAPEQLQGELVDARADLYALGCILHECVTGKPPFVAPMSVVRAQHLDHPPSPPSLHNPAIPRELDTLILRLLAKVPEDRLGYAVDVGAALVALGAKAEPEAPLQPYLYRPPFEGRKEAKAALEKAVYSVAHERRGGLWLVRGESGMGKTRLVMELGPTINRLRNDPSLTMNVLTATCPSPGAGAAPLSPLRPWLRTAADLVRHSREEADHVFGPRGRILSRYEPTLLQLPGQDEQPEPPPLAPEKARARVVRSMLEVLRALAAQGPVLFVLDDVQWADDLTLDVLEAFANADLAQYGTLLVATYRSEEESPAICELAKHRHVSTLALERLDAGSVVKIVAGMLAQREPPRAVLDALVHQANGNPFFISQYLHAALERGILRRDPDGRFCFDAHRAGAAIASLPLPETVEELIRARLDRLDAEGQALAQWAAVLGEDLDEALLLEGAKDKAAATAAFDTLLARRILEVTQAGRLRFFHDKLREIAYARIDLQARAAWHGRAGEALAARFGRAKEKAATLGHHFDRAGIYEKATQYFARAAVCAPDVNSAIPLYEAALATLRKTASTEARRAEMARLHERRGDALTLLAKYEDARAAYTAALEANPEARPVDRARRLRKRGTAWQLNVAFPEGLAQYDEAEAALGEGPRLKAWWNEWLRIQLERISIHYQLANVQETSRLRAAIDPVMEAWGTAKVRVHYFAALTQHNLRLERYACSAETSRYARKGVAAARRAGDTHELLGARFNLALIHWMGGRHEKAERELVDTLFEAKNNHVRDLQTRCSIYLATVMRAQGRVEQTEKRAQESLLLSQEENAQAYVGVAQGNLAWVALQRGNGAEAERLAQEAITRWMPRNTFPFQWVARMPLCAALFERGDLAGAIEQVNAVLAPNMQQRLPQRLALALAQAVDSFATGQTAQARRELRKALRLAEQRGYV